MFNAGKGTVIINEETNELFKKLPIYKTETTVFWYLGDEFIISTNDIDEIATLPSHGKHTPTPFNVHVTTISSQVEITE